MALDVHRFERAANVAVGPDRRAFMIVLEPFWTARFLVGWLVGSGQMLPEKRTQFLEPIGSVVVAETTVRQPK